MPDRKGLTRAAPRHRPYSVVLADRRAGDARAARPFRSVLNFQCAVNAKLLHAPGFPKGRGEHGGLLTEAELRELEVAFDAGESAVDFADRIVARHEERVRRAEWLTEFQGKP